MWCFEVVIKEQFVKRWHFTLFFNCFNPSLSWWALLYSPPSTWRQTKSFNRFIFSLKLMQAGWTNSFHFTFLSVIWNTQTVCQRVFDTRYDILTWCRPLLSLSSSPHQSVGCTTNSTAYSLLPTSSSSHQKPLYMDTAPVYEATQYDITDQWKS